MTVTDHYQLSGHANPLQLISLLPRLLPAASAIRNVVGQVVGLQQLGTSRQQIIACLPSPVRFLGPAFPLNYSDSDFVYYLIASQPVKKSDLDAIGGQQGLGFTRMYTRTARVIGPTQVSPVPPSLAVNS